MDKKTIRYVDFHDVIECLIATVESKDKYTSGHSSCVADMTLKLAQVLGITGIQLEIVHMAAHLHDIGKIGVPNEVLLKPGSLSEEEWLLIKQHPRIGYDILSHSAALQDIADIVLHHHERWDGKGYPDGLKGHEIPAGARIIALADSIDAMMSERPYRRPMTQQRCMEQIAVNKGVQFDPMFTELALSVCFPYGVAQVRG